MAKPDVATDVALSRILLDYIGEFAAIPIPTPAREWAKYCVLDLFGCSLAATAPRFSIGSMLREFVTREGGNPLAAIIGTPLRTAPGLAALVNGTFGYYCDNEPRHTRSVVHVLPAVVPAALAVGEVENVTGEQFLRAIVLGVDVACRMSLALDPKALYARGFHPTSVGGVFGAMAAAAYVLKLTGPQRENALGLAGLQATGLLSWLSDPTEQSRPLNCGVAARNGVTAASLAAVGFGGPREILEGKYTVFSAFTGIRRTEGITEGLGSRFLVAELAAKRHASCGYLHAGIDALLEILSEANLASPDVDRVTLHLASTAARLVDNNAVKSHNAQYVLAVATVLGRVTIDEILGERVAHPEVNRLASCVDIVHDEDLEKLYPSQYAAIVRVQSRGKEFRKRVDWPKGWPQNPMTHEEWSAKFQFMAMQVSSAEQATQIADYVLHIENLPSIRSLSEALTRTARP